MHEQVMVLGTLWRLDQARDTLIAEARALADKVRQVRQSIVESEALIADLDTQLSGLSKTEKEHSRRMSAYIKRRDNTRQAIDEGRITDFLVAEKQVSDCAAIVDTEEEAILELMEQQDALAESKHNAEITLGLRRSKLETARNKESSRRPDLEAELGVLTTRRDESRDPVRREVLSIYDQRRRKGLRIMAPLENKGCGGCKVKLPGTRYSDIKRDVDIFLCGNCGSFLSPGNSDEEEGPG